MNLLSHCLLLTSTSLQPTEMIILNGIIKGLYLGTKSSFFGVSTLHGVSSAIIVDDHESEESDMVVCALDLTSSNNLGQVRNDFSVVGSLVLVTTLLVVHQVVCLRLLCWVWSCSAVKWLSSTFWIKMKHKLKWERERWIRWCSNKKSEEQSCLLIYKMDNYNDGDQELWTSFRVLGDMLC